MNKTAILDMGLNNIKSIFNLSNKFSETYIFSELKEFKTNTDTIILPGNGNFGKGMEILSNKNLIEFIQNISQEIKIVGICLGLQLLMNESDESPDVKGLSLIEGKNIKIDINDDYNNPLLGWYNVKFIDTKKYENLNGCYFFNKNFVIDPVKRSIISGYLDNLPVFINEKNIYGIQFHPELSRNIGNYFFKKILEN